MQKRTEEQEDVFDLGSEPTRQIWEQVIEAIETYHEKAKSYPIVPDLNPQVVRNLLSSFQFKAPVKTEELVGFVVKGLTSHQLHFANPGYMGLYVPRPSMAGIFGDALAAGFNCQLAAWRANPFANELEQHLLRTIGEVFGLDRAEVHGTFTSGGSEANHTAVITALVHHFPQFIKQGLRGLKAQPIAYCSSEAHHSIHKAIQATGLGLENLREIPVDENLEMRVDLLEAQIANDRAKGYQPFLLAVTSGTTSAGAIDPLEPFLRICQRENLWCHLDAAYGGGAAFVPNLRHHFKGASEVDSITFDPHKWLSVAIGAGIYITKHKDVLKNSFAVDSQVIPKLDPATETLDPYLHSLQWSRRFIGLKLFMSLGSIGLDGYAKSISHQIHMGDFLRQLLTQSGWKIENKTPLPVICFTDSTHPQGRSAEYLKKIEKAVVSSGKSWISTIKASNGQTYLRACIINHQTGEGDIRTLVDLLNQRGNV